MKKIENVFFIELLRVAIGNKECLSSHLTDEEWEEVYSVCERQEVVGLVFRAIERLPREQQPPTALVEKWTHEVEVLKQRNGLIAKRCREVCEYYTKQGMISCVLMPFGEDSCHEDIDILCCPKEKKNGKFGLIEYVNFQYVSSTYHLKPKVVRQVVDWKTGSFPVDVRFKFSYLNCPWHDRWLQKWVEERMLSVRPTIGDGGYPVPSNIFNVVYQLIHLYRKLFCESIRFSHLYDYYMVLRKFRDKGLEFSGESLGFRDEGLAFREESLEFSGESLGEKDSVMNIIGHVGMKKFAGAVMYVLQTVFGMPDEYLICKSDARHGSFVLNMVTLAGEYTRHIERTRTLSHLGRLGHHLYWMKRNRPFFTQYPAEIFFELYKRMKG